MSVCKIYQRGQLVIAHCQAERPVSEEATQNIFQTLNEKIEEDECKGLIIDLEQMDYINSTLAAAIKHLSRVSDQKGKVFALAAVGALAKGILKITGPSEEIPMYSTVEDALNTLVQ